jgi:hypothetical protein
MTQMVTPEHGIYDDVLLERDEMDADTIIDEPLPDGTEGLELSIDVQESTAPRSATQASYCSTMYG